MSVDSLVDRDARVVLVDVNQLRVMRGIWRLLVVDPLHLVLEAPGALEETQIRVSALKSSQSGQVAQCRGNRGPLDTCAAFFTYPVQL